MSAAGATVIEFPITNIPPNGTDLAKRLEYDYKEAINTFLADLGEAAPVASLAEIIAFNSEELADRAPYGQGYLEASQGTAVTAEAFARLSQQDNGLARNALDIIFENHNLDVIVSDVGQLYAPAGYPALSVPAGYAEDGTPQSIVFVGGFFAEPQLLAVGYAYEQATQARVAPDLEATMALIQAINE